MIFSKQSNVHLTTYCYKQIDELKVLY